MTRQLGERKVNTVSDQRFFVNLRQSDVESVYRRLAYIVHKQDPGRGRVSQRGNTVVMDAAAYAVLERLHGDIDGNIRNGTMWIGDVAYDVQKAIV